MKKIMYTILLLLPLSASAQVKVWDKEIYYDIATAEVVVNLKTEVEQLEGTVAMDFVISDNFGNTQTLPAIVYASSSRYWQVVRVATTPWVYKNKQQRIITEYTTRVAYQEWMNHASLTVNQVRYEKCGEWLVDTMTIVQDIMVVPNPLVKITPEPQIWQPDPALYARMVGFIIPEVEGVKHRMATAKLNIDYPVNVSRVIPEYGNNRNELPKVDTMISMLYKDDFIVVNSYSITGYASPEGRYTSNEALAKNRSNGFRTYVKQGYNIGNISINTQWTGEDWEGLAKAISDSGLEYKDRILHIINTTSNPDARDAKIKAIDGGMAYNELLKEYYPPLRRIELRADYTVRSFSDEEAKEMIYKRPELLSLDEMYRVALFYKPGTEEYREVYEIAAKHFPKDVIANNNAAAAILLGDDVEAAKVYLDAIKDDPRSNLNRGVVAYIEGDLESAKMYFRVAAEAGYEAAARNLELLENATK